MKTSTFALLFIAFSLFFISRDALATTCTLAFTFSPNPVCCTSPVTIENLSSGGGSCFPQGYDWDFGGGATNYHQSSNGADFPNFTVTFICAGNCPIEYTIKVTETGTPTNFITQIITVYPAPPSCSFTATPNPVCTGTLICFDAPLPNCNNPTPLINFAWNFGDGGVDPFGSNQECYTYGTQGNYTVTLTESNVCGATSCSQLIQVKNLIGDFTWVNDVCNPSATFTATYSCGVIPIHYSWIFNGGTPANSTASTVTVTWPSAGTYPVTLNLSDGAGNTFSLTKNVTITNNNPPPFTIEGDQSNCDPNGSIYQPGNSSGYSWQHQVLDANGNPITSWVAGSSFSYNFSGATCIQGIAGYVVFQSTTTSIPFCSTKDTLQVNCCCGPIPGQSGDLIYDQSSLDKFGGDHTFTTSNTTGQTLFLNGLFTVNTNITMDGINVLMGPYAKIVVTGGKSLSIINAAIVKSWCGVMWDGIYADGATNSIIINGIFNGGGSTVLVQDAINLIVSANGSSFTINYALLNLNYKNIVVSTFSTSHTGSIKHSTISCSNTVLSLPPYAGVRTYSGVDLNGVYGITIGDATNAANVVTFNNMDFGVFSKISSPTIKNCNFQNITGSQICPTCACNIGTGICVIGGTSSIFSNYNLIVGGAGTNDDCTFSNCRIGIHVSNYSSSKIQYNTFSGTDIGIYIKNAKSKSHIINNNILSNFISGIYCVDIYSNLAGSPIKDNKFNWNFVPTTNGSYAIQIQNTLANSNILTLSGNLIDYCRSGIVLTNLLNAPFFSPVTVSGNTIHFSQVSNCTYLNNLKFYGIRVQGGSGSDIKNNLISSLFTSPTVCADTTLRGISVENSQGVHVRTNGSSLFPLKGLGDAILMYGNCTGSYLDCNIIDNCYDGFHFKGPQSSNYASIMDELPGAIASGNQWSALSVGGKALRGAIFPTVHWYYKGSGNYIPSPIALNTLSLFNGNNPELTNNADPCSSGGLKLADDPLTDSIAYREQQFGNIIDSSLEYAENADQFHYYDNQYFYQSAAADTNLLSLGQKDDIKYQNYFDTLSGTNIGSAERIRKAISENNLDSAEWLNNSMVVSIAPESNRKEVNNFYLKLLREGSLTPEDTTYLLNIAREDPLSNGDAVYTARVILGYDPEGSSVKLYAEEVYADVKPINLYPNPADNEINIENISGDDLNIDIFSIEGIFIRKLFISSAQNRIVISTVSLIPGIYEILSC